MVEPKRSACRACVARQVSVHETKVSSVKCGAFAESPVLPKPRVRRVTGHTPPPPPPLGHGWALNGQVLSIPQSLSGRWEGEGG